MNNIEQVAVAADAKCGAVLGRPGNLIDRLTGKTSRIGLFSNVGATRYPMRHPHLCVFASLTDGRGKTPLEITIIDTDERRSGSRRHSR